MTLKPGIAGERHAWSANHPQTNWRRKKRMLSWIKDKSSHLFTSSTAWCLNPTPALQISLEPARYFPEPQTLTPRAMGPNAAALPLVSWTLPWRPEQIRHDECRLFAVWQTHSFTVRWRLNKGHEPCNPESSWKRTREEPSKKKRGGQSVDVFQKIRWWKKGKTSVLK